MTEIKRYEDEIAALQEQVRALVADNENLKVACGGDGNYIDCPGCSHSQYIESPETPATDAALREIRAQAVEEYAITVGAEKNGAIYAARIRSGEQP